MNIKFRILCVIFGLFFTSAGRTVSGAEDWWQPVAESNAESQVWRYRIPLRVTAPAGLDYEGYPIEFMVDFRQALDALGKTTETLDIPNSLRLIATDNSEEIACQYDDLKYQKRRDDPGNGRGYLFFILDQLKGGSSREYYLYFDTIAPGSGGVKAKAPYPELSADFDAKKKSLKVDTGKISLLLKFDGGNYRNGIKSLAIKHPDKNIVIPIYGYGVDSFGMNKPAFDAEFVNGPVFAYMCFEKHQGG